MASRNEDRLPDLGPSQAAEVRLFSELASVATSRTSSMGALQQCLYLVCAYVGWPVGHLYLTASDASGELAPSKVWYLADPEEFEVLRSVTEKTRVSPGIGLPGRVLSSGEPEWIPDVQEGENFPRAQLAQDIGVRGAFAFPVPAKGLGARSRSLQLGGRRHIVPKHLAVFLAESPAISLLHDHHCALVLHGVDRLAADRARDVRQFDGLDNADFSTVSVGKGLICPELCSRRLPGHIYQATPFQLGNKSGPSAEPERRLGDPITQLS